MFLNNVSTYYLSENILRPHCKEQSAKSVEQKWSVILRILRIQAQILHEETGDKHACALLSFKQIMLCFATGMLKVYRISWNARNKLYDGIPYCNNAKNHNKVSLTTFISAICSWFLTSSVPTSPRLHSSPISLFPFYFSLCQTIGGRRESGEKKKNGWRETRKRRRTEEKRRIRRKENKGKRSGKTTRGVENEGKRNKWGEWDGRRKLGRKGTGRTAKMNVWKKIYYNVSSFSMGHLILWVVICVSGPPCVYRLII